MTPQELKESILWNAIQGKFTTQFQTENIEEVIGKVHVSSVADEDAYFDIPRNWCWARIGDIFDLVNGKAFKPTDWSEQGIPIVRIQNLNDPNAPFNYFAGEIEEKYFLYGGELLFSWSGTPGTSFGAFIWDGGQAVLNQHIFIVYPKIKLDYEYAKYALNGELRIFIAKAHGGAGLKHITRKEFDSCFLPIPPLAEQKRIVAKIEELLPLVERYEKAWSRLEDFNKRFPGDMQKSILQMAIQGKLVEQRPEEGDTKGLVKECQKQKEISIKTGKYRKEPFRGKIEDDSIIPYSLPDSWSWMYISDMSLFQEGPGILAVDFRDSGVPLIRIAGMQTDVVSLDGCNYLDEDRVKEKWEHFRLDEGDIVISTSASMDKIAEVTGDAVGAIPYTGLIRFKMYGGISKEYFKHFIKSPFYESQVNEQKAGGTIKHYGPSHLKKMLIPVPPLAEQKRIVARLQELLPLCERLK